MRFVRLVWMMSCAFVGMALISCAPPETKAKRPTDDAIPVTVTPVRIAKVDRTIPVVGTLFPKDEATLAAEVEGKVEQTMAEFGDRLTNGQIIAQIDTTTYDVMEGQAAANLARVKATSANAEQNLKRIRELNKSAIASTSDLDQAVAASAQALAEVKAAEAAEAIARLNLDRSHVRAPFDAAVAERIASSGDFMKVGSPLFRIVNDGVLKYIVQAPERYAGQVRKEQLIRFTVDAYPNETFEGRVYLISPAVNTTTRGFNFGALVQNRERKLKANSFARGELLLEKGAPMPLIPLDCVVSFAGITKVFVIDNGVARVRVVQTGRIRDGFQEVLSGLKEGEVVAVSGQTKLFEGAKVRVKPLADARTT
jgi:membrane fusion protein, multidrug efflux system